MESTPYERLLALVDKATATRAKVREVEIPMRDGTYLAADVYVPEGPSPAPAVVVGTPYDKSQLIANAEGQFWREAGYAAVIYDVRGRGKSGGDWRAFVDDGPDGHDVVEWVSGQPWCTSDVGMAGISYAGWVVWATAAERPPHLRCAVSIAAAGRWMEEIPYTHGIFQLYFLWWVYRTQRRVICDPSPLDWERLLRLPLPIAAEELGLGGRTWDDMVDHDSFDEFWTALRLDERHGAIDIPALHIAGWLDQEDLLGAIHHYEGMRAASPARDRQQLIVGPWTHIATRFPSRAHSGVDFGPSAAIDMNAAILRFVDRWLRDDRETERDPATLLFETGTDAWRTDVCWPPPTTEVSLHLRWQGDGTGALSPEGGDDPMAELRYDPADSAGAPIDFRKLTFSEPPLDQRSLEARADVLVYTSAALDADVVVGGWPHVELFASSDCEDTDWHVKITDVHADGRSIRVSSGCLRASYRESLARPTPLVAGEVYRFDVECAPLYHAFKAGHRVRLTVTSADFPWFERSLNVFGRRWDDLGEGKVATNVVHHSVAHPSRLVLAVVNGWGT